MHLAEALRKRITLSYQAVSDLVYLLANPGDLMLTFLLSNMWFPDSLQILYSRFTILTACSLISEALLCISAYNLPIPSPETLSPVATHF